jgi:glycosyltransferase involved in cell wall biosynthesis
MERSMAGVDVAVPCYQYGRFLRQCVSSVLNQDLRDVRVLVIDNGSTDDSREVAQELAASDRRVEVVSHRVNLGPHHCYNEGIDWAAAEYFLVLDADDFLVPGSLSRAVAVMQQRRDVSFTHGMEARILPGATAPLVLRGDQDAAWTISAGRDFIERLCRRPINPVGSPTVIRRTSAQKRVGYYRPHLPYTDDLEMWLRLAAVGTVAQTDAVQAVRRLHEGQVSARYQRDNHVRDFGEREAAFESFFTQEGRLLPGSERLLKLARRRLGDHAYWSALSHVCRGHVRAGIELLRFSSRRRPLTPLVPPVGWILGMERPMERLADIGAEMIGRRRA